jgi:hypothetical protein
MSRLTYTAECGARYRVEPDRTVTVLLLCGGKSPFIHDEDDDFLVCPSCARLERDLTLMTAEAGKDGAQ